MPGNAKKYPAFTLLEMLLVLSVLMIVGSVSVSSFSGLESSVSLNEESQNIAQDIRNLQRSAMLLEREADESWLYGLGIDFSDYETTGNYRTFKWCSQYSGYGSARTRNDLPDYDDEQDIMPGNAHLPIVGGYGGWEADCSLEPIPVNSYLAKWSTGYPTVTDTGLNPSVNMQYLLFEAVSGRAFFYDSDGAIQNYESNGEISSTLEDFVLSIETKVTTKTITVKNLSGKISITSQPNE